MRKKEITGKKNYEQEEKKETHTKLQTTENETKNRTLKYKSPASDAAVYIQFRDKIQKKKGLSYY